MFRQSPSRNQRTKRLKVKHVLQIFILLAIGIWLLYQVKHSHDKKKEFENTRKISEKVESEDERIKLGRKDLPHGEESASETETQNEEETEEEDESKPEETEEGRGVGDDEIDEHDQEREDEEAERGEDFFDEEEKDREEKDNEKEGQNDGGSSSEDQDPDGGDKTTQEAREEIYKGDDASSAVVRDTHEIQDSGGSNMEGHIANAGNNQSEHENTSHGIQEATANENDSDPKMGVDEKTVANANPSVNATAAEEKVGEDVKAEANLSANATATEERDTEKTLTESKHESTSNSTLTTESNNWIEMNDYSTADDAKTQSSSIQNGTETVMDSTQHQNASEASGIPTGYNLQTVVSEKINSSTADSKEKSEANTEVALSIDASGNSSSVIPELQVMEANATARAEDGSSSLTTNENAEVVHGEKSNKTTAMEENKDGSTSSMTNENEHTTASQQDTMNVSDSSIPEEVKEARIDLGTLPDIKTEGTNHDDVATE